MRSLDIMFIACVYWLVLNVVTRHLQSGSRPNCDATAAAGSCDFSDEEASMTTKWVGILITNVITLLVSFTCHAMFKTMYNIVRDDANAYDVSYSDDDRDHEDAAAAADDDDDDRVTDETWPAWLELRTVDEVFGYAAGTFAYRLNDDNALQPLMDDVDGLDYDLLYCHMSGDGQWPDVTMYIDEDAGWSGGAFREARVRQITSRDLADFEDYNELEGETGAGEVMFVLEGFENVYEVND